VIDRIAEAAALPQARVAELVAEVKKHTDEGGPASARRSLLPEHLRVPERPVTCPRRDGD